MKYIITVIVLSFFSNLLYANMANPYTEGSIHSGLYSIKNCSVEKEFIQIKIVKGEEETEAQFTITYYINSDSDKLVPLVFIGIGLYGSSKVLVNGKEEEQREINPKKESFLKENLKGYAIQFTAGDTYDVEVDDLVYFNAQLRKGKNVVVIKYSAQLEYNRRDFIKKYNLEYSLYPSNFWESFGPIHVTLEPVDEVDLLNSNLGEATIKNNTYSWTITDNSKDISLDFSLKYSWFTKLLIGLSPFGLACLISAIFLFLHAKLIKKRRLQFPHKYNFWVPVGIILNCLVFNSVFIFSFDLLNWLTTDTKSGYYLLAVFVFVPLFLIFYSASAWIFDRYVKRKILNQ